MRIGFSSDIHRLVAGRKLMLSGVHVPYELGELAHSDGDVVYHAASEAILGALALGDLGKHFPGTPEYKDIEQVSFDEVLSRSDVISIHCPLTDQTRGLVDREAFSKMKDGVIIINTARGAIIDEEALVDALKSGKVYAAGLDVVDGEPVHEKKPIFDCDNATITAHIAWAPEEARFRTIRIATENLRNYIAGVPTSVIA